MNNTFSHAYVIHKRPYTDSQWLIDLLVEGQGRIRAIARTKGKQAVRHRAELQPFSHHNVMLAGGGQLKYLVKFEPITQLAPKLAQRRLFCGFYMNELAERIVPLNEPLESLYEVYQHHILKLTEDTDEEAVLRSFELQLLDLLGFGIDWEVDISGEPIQAAMQYHYVPEGGWLPVAGKAGFNGETIMALAQGSLATDDAKRIAKQFCRGLLKPLLGNKPLKSRELFVSR